jgi:hypothetical protein
VAAIFMFMVELMKADLVEEKGKRASVYLYCSKCYIITMLLKKGYAYPCLDTRILIN